MRSNASYKADFLQVQCAAFQGEIVKRWDCSGTSWDIDSSGGRWYCKI